MIESIGIKNYKSIVDLKFDVGRVNVFIGENGSGKSNILEAIALASAAEANKLDNEFLTSRGIRVTSSNLIFSSFIEKNRIDLEIIFKNPDGIRQYQIHRTEGIYSKLYKIDSKNQEIEGIINRFDKNREVFSGQAAAYIDEITSFIRKTIETENNIDKYNFHYFIVYSPENTALRSLHQEGQIEPLGINGEGLLKLLKVINRQDSVQSEILKHSLQLFDWFEKIDIPDIKEDEAGIRMLDKFTNTWLDQCSVNEGFLFVLFYTTLMISSDTPSIFAIDNVDASLNPKLCTTIVSDIVKLAKQFDKQCFLTVHNPAILDGIDLGDDEQRLFVVSRNRKGHTRVKRIGIESKPVSSTGEDLKLSEAFLRGYLGGLPKNF